MSLISASAARAHAREDADVPDEVLQPYIDGAEASAAAYLNRALFADAAALAAAQDAAPGALGAANAAYGEAMQAAASVLDTEEKGALIELANARIATARVVGRRTIFGMVATPDVLSAVLLTFGHLYANRESVVIGLSAVELPEGAKAILRPHRRVQMP